MPISIEPNQLFPIVLDCDKDKPSPPTFWARSQSMRGQLRVAKVLDRWVTESEVTPEQLFSDAVDVLSEVIVRWDGMPVEFSKDALWDVLTYQEARELLRKVAHNEHMTPEEKKS